SDVVHLLAELAENATSFSAADTPVAVSGHLLNSGGGVLGITDQGGGMGAEGMGHANWGLDNPPGGGGAGGGGGGGCFGGRARGRLEGNRGRLAPGVEGGVARFGGVAG